MRCEIICQGQHTCSSLLWVDSTGCLVILFSQLSENLSGHLSPNLSPGAALRAMLSLKMDTKSSKVGAEWGEGWAVGVGICCQARRVMKGVQPEVLLMVVLCPGDWMSSTGQQLDEEDVVNMSHAAWWKKEPFYVGGYSTSSVCVPVSKGEAEHLREKFKSTECKKHLGVISQNRDCRNQKHTKRQRRNESLKILLPCYLGSENCLDYIWW